MYGLEKILNSDFLFVYIMSFIILFTLLYDLLRRINFFNNKKIDALISLIICLYVFLTHGYKIINFVLSLGTMGMIIVFGLLLTIIIIMNFWQTAKKEATGYF